MNNDIGFGPAAIAAMAGSALSLIMNYIPGLNTRFDRLTPDMQRAIMGAMIIATSILMALWQCSGTTPSDAALVGSLCEGGLNWKLILTNAVFALVGNQSTDRISPKPRSDEKNEKALKA
jgi:hypothetical protein